MSEIKDSGNRTEFETGAVRDMGERKGRCDLLPLHELSGCLYAYEDYTCDHSCESSLVRITLIDVLSLIDNFEKTGEIRHLAAAFSYFSEETFGDIYTAIIELSKHFEDGAKKYGEYNWQKGIPVSSYINSAVRHCLKWARGDNDERHDRAFLWNLVCCIWTAENKPELNTYAKEKKDD